jgi:hypothetical protein
MLKQYGTRALVYPYSSASNKSILKDYVMDITVLKELVQNAEDAKATEVTFVWDWSDPLYIIYCRYIIHITYTYIYIYIEGGSRGTRHALQPKHVGQITKPIKLIYEHSRVEL